MQVRDMEILPKTAICTECMGSEDVKEVKIGITVLPICVHCRTNLKAIL